MKALILAAGKGTRISRYLSGNPKCTVDIGNEQLIQYTINMLRRKGITEIGIVVGYRHEVVRKSLEGMEVKFFYNPFYDVTNSVASAWFALDFLKEYDDTIIMNGDVYLEEGLLDKILMTEKSPVMFADASRKEEADYKFYYEEGILKKYGKELSGDDITGEYIGIGKFNKLFMHRLVESLNTLITNNNHSVWWENTVYALVGKENVYVEETDGMFWAEVDYIEDYERILRFRGYEADFALKVSRISEKNEVNSNE